MTKKSDFYGVGPYIQIACILVTLKKSPPSNAGVVPAAEDTMNPRRESDGEDRTDKHIVSPHKKQPAVLGC